MLCLLHKNAGDTLDSLASGNEWLELANDIAKSTMASYKMMNIRTKVYVDFISAFTMVFLFEHGGVQRFCNELLSSKDWQ